MGRLTVSAIAVAAVLLCNALLVGPPVPTCSCWPVLPVSAPRTRMLAPALRAAGFGWGRLRLAGAHVGGVDPLSGSGEICGGGGGRVGRRVHRGGRLVW